MALSYPRHPLALSYPSYPRRPLALSYLSRQLHLMKRFLVAAAAAAATAFAKVRPVTRQSSPSSAAPRGAEPKGLVEGHRAVPAAATVPTSPGSRRALTQAGQRATARNL